MATLIGRVGMVVKGAWDSSVAYDTLDVVTYNNNTYIAKQASPAGTLPTNTTYWQLSLDASLLATKVSGATSGNFAGLDANGNLTDSGIAAGNTSISSIGDGTLTGAVSAENEAIDAIVNVYGSKNLYNLDSYSLKSGFTISNNVVSNSVTDTYQGWQFYLYAIDTNNQNTMLYYEYITTDGKKEIPVTIPNGTKYFRIYHSGSTTNFLLDIPFTKTGNFIFSMNVLGHNTTTVGGLSFTDIMLRDARISDSTYVPYAMTNRELTELNVFNEVIFTAYASDVTINTYEAYDIGNIVNFYIKFTVTNNHAFYDILTRVSKRPKLISVVYPVLDGNTSTIYLQTQYSIYIDSSSNFCVSSSGLPAGTYVVIGTYMTKD